MIGTPRLFANVTSFPSAPVPAGSSSDSSTLTVSSFCIFASISRPRRPRSARAVGRVVEVLELRENELRNDERAANEAAPDDVRDAAVDDDRRIEEDARVRGAAANP